MSVFPTSAVSPDDTSVKVRERYASAALNRKLTGYPLGVFRGFNPSVTGPEELTLSVDDTFGDSVAVAEDVGGYGLNVRQTANVVLDFTGHTSWPTYVVMEVTYSPPAPVGTGVTSATLLTVAPSTIDFTVVIGVVTAGPFVQGEEINFSGGSTGRLTSLGASLIVALRGPVAPGETAFGASSGASAPVTSVTDPGAYPKQVKVCLVSKPGATIVASSSIPVDRQGPFAFLGVTSGFMPGGSIEQLQLAVAITSEVQAARSGFLQTFPLLDARLDAELSGGGTDGMASRLGLVAKTQEGSLFAAPTPGWGGTGTSANVSVDFLLKTAALLATDKGVVVFDPVTAAGDNVNNISLVFGTQYSRLIDTVGRKVYGKLEYRTFPLTGTLTFTNGSTAVSGGGTTQFVTDGVVAGDIVLSPNGNYFAVDSVTGENNLILRTGYASTGPAVEDIIAPPLRRYEIKFQIYNNGDVAFSLPITTDFRYSYQERFDAADRPFSEATFHPSLRGRDAGATITSDGTTADARVVPSTTDGRLGAVKVNSGSFNQNIALIAGANMTVGVLDTGTEYQITFSAASGPTGPSSYPGPMAADAGAGFAGTGANYAVGNHSHPASAAYATPAQTGINVHIDNFNNQAGTAATNPGFTPSIAMWLGQIGSAGGFCMGAAVGTAAIDQVATFMGSGPNSEQGVVAGDGITNANRWAVLPGGFQSSAVTATSTIGLQNMFTIVVVIGDNS